MQIVSSPAEVLEAAEVAPVEGVVAEGGDFFVGFGQAEVGVDDRKDAGFADEGQKAGRDEVNSGEGKALKTGGQRAVLGLSGGAVARRM